MLAWSLLVLTSVAQEQNSDIDSWTVEHCRLATEAHRQNNFDVAEREYHRVLSRKPKFAEVYQNLGILYHQQRRFREAAQRLQTAVSLKPDLLEAQVAARRLVADLRSAGVPAARSFEERPLKAQLKMADRSGAAFAAIIGERELADGRVTLRRLYDGEQTTVDLADAAARLVGDGGGAS